MYCYRFFQQVKETASKEIQGEDDHRQSLAEFHTRPVKSKPDRISGNVTDSSSSAEDDLFSGCMCLEELYK